MTIERFNPTASVNIAYVALGSNLGDRKAVIDSAIAALRATPGVEAVKTSRIIETEPVGQPNQRPYLNAAAELKVRMTPRQLLTACLAIEAMHGRDRSITHRWGPRTLDLDILLFGDLIVDEPGLQIPHPHMADRNFVLAPLAEVAPTVVHPLLGQTVQSLLDNLQPHQMMEYPRFGSCSCE